MGVFEFECCMHVRIQISALQVVEFAEKPKGEKLTAMRVDTSILGVDKEM